MRPASSPPNASGEQSVAKPKLRHGPAPRRLCVDVLGPVDTPAARVAYPHFLAELRKLGFREGENLIVDIRQIDQSVPMTCASRK